MSAAVAAKTVRMRPISTRLLLEIPRTERCVLRVELVRWEPEREPVVRFSTTMLGRQGDWFTSPRRVSLRPSECRRVAEALLEVAE